MRNKVNHMGMNVNRTVLFTLCIMFGMIAYAPFVANTLTIETCRTVDNSTLNLTPEIGPFVYVTAGEDGRNLLHSLDSSQEGLPIPLDSSLTLSPSRRYVAGIDVLPDSWRIGVIDATGEVLYLGADTEYHVTNLVWLGDEYLLTFLQVPSGDPYGSEQEIQYYWINPFARTYSLEVPPRTLPFYNELPNIPLPQFYRFSFDGQYMWLGESPLYNFVNDESVYLDGFRGGVPAYRSHRVLRIDSANFVSEGTYQVFIYDFESEMEQLIATFSPSGQMPPYYDQENAWSPDEDLWAFTIYRDTLPQYRHLNLLVLDSGSIISTCFGLVGALGWSPDSRYLALQGVLEGEDMDESLGVYIYDTQTGDIYQAYQGRADIIGWMAAE